MKRLFAAVILIVLLAVCCTVGHIIIKNTCDFFEAEIKKCITAAEKGDFLTARHLSTNIDKKWQNKRALLSLFVYHSTIEEIDNSVARLKAYAYEDSRRLYLSECEATLLHLREIYAASSI